AEVARAETVQWRYLDGMIRIASTDWTGAKETLERALALEPDHLPSLAAYGEVLFHSGRRQEALQVFDSVLLHMPWSITAHALSGLILLESRRFTDAYPHLEIVNRMVSDDPWSYYHLMECLSNMPGRSRDRDGVERAMRARFRESELPMELRERLRSGEIGDD
ncbi:tetratricopeptide repeat protein, partial [bacterium]|nr:tetratricopeptide repeat protein [candidate division CSSED10-310 bacterium]